MVSPKTANISFIAPKESYSNRQVYKSGRGLSGISENILKLNTF
jgi:hypothetical protein